MSFDPVSLDPAKPDVATASSRGQWMTLVAAFLGWMFDGFEMGLFPLVGRPALKDLLGESGQAHVDVWFGLMIAGFLVGAASGGVLFGWLGDRLGRVRAMTLSVLTYAVFMGLCGIADSPAKVFVFRFISSLGMGGEWSLGVALVMEIWPDKSRGMLAGLIGAASNVGFLSIALVGLGLGRFIDVTQRLLLDIGLQKAWVDQLVSHSGWRLMMLIGAVPALFTFFIQLLVPESRRWEHEKAAGLDLVLVGPRFVGRGDRHGGAAGDDRAVAARDGTTRWPCGSAGRSSGWPWRSWDTSFRSSAISKGQGPRRRNSAWRRRPTTAADAAGGVPERRGARSGRGRRCNWLRVGRASWSRPGPSGRDLDPKSRTVIVEGDSARSWTQILSGLGAIVGTMAGALMGTAIGRRLTYTLLCAGSLVCTALFLPGEWRIQFGVFARRPVARGRHRLVLRLAPALFAGAFPHAACGRPARVSASTLVGFSLPWPPCKPGP